MRCETEKGDRDCVCQGGNFHMVIHHGAGIVTYSVDFDQEDIVTIFEELTRFCDGMKKWLNVKGLNT